MFPVCFGNLIKTKSLLQRKSKCFCGYIISVENCNILITVLIKYFIDSEYYVLEKLTDINSVMVIADALVDSLTFMLVFVNMG